MGRLITSLRCLLYTRPDIVGICVCVVIAGLIGVGFTGVWSSVRNSLVSLVDDLAGDAPSVDEDPIMVLTGGKASMADMEDRWAYALGLTEYGTGNLFGAIADFDTAIRLKPDDPKAYYNRGFAKENLGHSDAASADYETAIRLKPNYDETGNNRASAKSEVQGKNIEETISEGERMLQQLMAESNLEQSPAVSPESSEETKPELERNHAAPSSIDRAAQIDPNYDKAIYNGTLASHQVQSAF